MNEEFKGVEEPVVTEEPVVAQQPTGEEKSIVQRSSIE